MVPSHSLTRRFQATRHLVQEVAFSTTMRVSSRSSTVPFQIIALHTVQAFTILVVHSPSSTVLSQGTKRLALKTLPVVASLMLANSTSPIVPSQAIRHLVREEASPSLAARLPLPPVPF